MEKLNLEKVKIDKGGSGNILICGISERLTTTGKPYCELFLSDGEMKVTAKMWDITKDILQEYEKKVVYMDITLSGYNGKDNYIVRNIEYCKGSPDVLEFIRSAPLSAESMYRVILSVVDSSVTGEYAGSLAELTKRIYEKTARNCFTGARPNTFTITITPVCFIIHIAWCSQRRRSQTSTQALTGNCSFRQQRFMISESSGNWQRMSSGRLSIL